MPRLRRTLAFVSLSAFCSCSSVPAGTGETAANPRFARHLSSRPATPPLDQAAAHVEMSPGETYSGFVTSAVKPALDQNQSVAVRIDRQNYFIARDGQPAPTDAAYLGELSDYLKGERKDSRALLEALLRALTDSDPSGWRRLSREGQTVATDFLALYTVESNRRRAGGCKSGSGEVDLAATTFVSVYVAETDKVMKHGELSPGAITDWAAWGNSGRGLAESRSDRLALQKKIAEQVASNAAARAALPALESVIGDTGGDVIQSVFEHLADCDGPRKLSGAQGKALVSSFLDYMGAVKAEAPNVQ